MGPGILRPNMPELMPFLLVWPHFEWQDPVKRDNNCLHFSRKSENPDTE